VAYSAMDAKGVVPGLGSQGQDGLRHGAELCPVMVHPLRHFVVAAQGNECLGCHGAVVGSTACLLWSSVAQSLECVVNSTLHSTPPRSGLLGHGACLCPSHGYPLPV